MDGTIGKLREGMERGDDAVEGVLNQGGGGGLPQVQGSNQIALAGTVLPLCDRGRALPGHNIWTW